MKTGLFFGSFNPVHIGHLVIANYFIEFTDIEEVWFIVSPHNPLKEKTELLDCKARLDLLKIAVKGDKRFKVSDIEFDLSQPSYTIDTLQQLTNLFPEIEFTILMGSDGLPAFNQWKDYKTIRKQFTRYIYPRDAIEATKQPEDENIRFVDAPRIDISSTFIRQKLSQGIDIRYFLPSGVFDRISEMAYYGYKR